MKSRQRVGDHGEVFTPAWVIEDMLDLVKPESERVDSRFLEPACGSGNFLIPVLCRKLNTVRLRHGRNDFEKRHYALFSLMCVYGIELLSDNVAECRTNLLSVLVDFLDIAEANVWTRAAHEVLRVNIVHGDALTMTTASGEAITFPEWGYFGRGKFQRRDFGYDSLTQLSSFDEDTLFGDPGSHPIFTPTKTFPLMSVEEIAG
jgi:N-6 DNA Methylase